MVENKDRYPREIVLETTNKCNLRCRFCHFHGENVKISRRVGSMDPGIWKKLLQEIKGWDKPCTILTHGAGEPLLYPHLEELLTCACGIPHVGTGFMTNGMLLTPDVAKMLVRLQVNSIALSIDGVVSSTHDYFRRNANLEQIEKNVLYLIGEKKRTGSSFPSLMFNMVGYPDILDQEEAYVKKWLPHADSVVISKFRPIGSRKLWSEAGSPDFVPCPLLYNQAVISIDGDVGLCCEDIHLDVPVGNVQEEELLTLYNNSPVLGDYRKAHEKSDIDGLKLCSDCHVWGSQIVFKNDQIVVGGMKAAVQTSPAGKVYRKL